MLIDRFGRVHNYLRISVTDRCNQRCLFCMPLDLRRFHSSEEILSFEEIVLVVQVANELGIDRVRITGGEPLVRRDLPTLIQMIREQTTTKEISLTTNGLLLERFAPALKDAGLTRVNVSLHSLKAERFSKLTRFGSLEMVLRGIRAALDRGVPCAHPQVPRLRALSGVDAHRGGAELRRRGVVSQSV
jgi:cyclic pyranopterin phosphate synthase